MTRTADPRAVVASFDSASVLHASTAAALRGEPFPHLGQSPLSATAVRVAGRLPWPLLREIYTRIGGAEGVDPDRLAEVDLGAVARAFADGYPDRTWPAVMIGASNGALTHLAALLQIPWLPTTVLVPVARRGDPTRPDQALSFGRRVAGPLLERNPDVVLHQMHDAEQDRLMTSRMTYFRTKWLDLPSAYVEFLERRLAPDAPVIVVDDTSTWPVARVGERHVFQNGGRGGLDPDGYAARPGATPLDEEVPEAEWGTQPALVAAVIRWARGSGRPVVRLAVPGPQAAAAPVARTVRERYAALGRPTDRLIVPSFVLGDPWRTLQIGAVPYWMFFPVRPALDALGDFLGSGEPFDRAMIMMFQHGVDSAGGVTPDDLRRTVFSAVPRLRFVGLRPAAAPRDIGSLGRYGAALARVPAEPTPWTPMPVADALAALRRHGLSVTSSEPARAASADRAPD